jgi:hypothetical protein
MAKTGHKEQFNFLKLVFVLSFPLKAFILSFPLKAQLGLFLLTCPSGLGDRAFYLPFLIFCENLINFFFFF